MFYREFGKRLIDSLLAACALVGLSPVIAILALLVKVKLGSPIVFKQPRPGLNEKIFYLYKFRSMTNKKDESGALLPDSQRLTKFGRFLRSSSADELLELLNIIKGDMAIVGPRPLSIHYLSYYTPEERRRHDVRPGLTGLAQVSGRNNLDWEQRFALDLKYVDCVSFFNDARIIARTVGKVLKSADVSVRGTSSMMDFGPYSTIKEVSQMKASGAGTTYGEIGSFYWIDSSQVDKNGCGISAFLPETEDSTFSFSGRTAIALALEDILSTKDVKQAILPSYGCVSMAQPFFDRGIPVSFYSVDYRDGKFTYEVPNVGNDTVVLVMSYFGLDTSGARMMIDTLCQRGVTVIEDITHSFLASCSHASSSDYYVVSLRKWFAVPAGGWVGKRLGFLSSKPSRSGSDAVTQMIEGMKEKRQYLAGEVSNKEHFLRLQAEFERDLIHVDWKLQLDKYSQTLLDTIDVPMVIHRRRNNAQLLIDHLSTIQGKGLQLPTIDLGSDTPLFVPVFLDQSKRDLLRDYLIEKGVYCPVHWPEIMGASRTVQGRELSIVCDQRYGSVDMEYIAGCVREWFQAYASEGTNSTGMEG